MRPAVRSSRPTLLGRSIPLRRQILSACRNLTKGLTVLTSRILTGRPALSSRSIPKKRTFLTLHAGALFLLPVVLLAGLLFSGATGLGLAPQMAAASAKSAAPAAAPDASVFSDSDAVSTTHISADVPAAASAAPVSAPPVIAAAAGSPASKVLLVYDSLGEGTAKEGNIASLERLLSAFGAEIKVVDLDEYEPGTLADYNLAVEVLNLPERAGEAADSNRAFSGDLAGFSGKFLQIGGEPSDQIRKKMGTALTTEKVLNTPVALSDAQESGLSSAFVANEMILIAGSPGETIGRISAEGKDGSSYPFAVKQGSYMYAPYFEQGNGSVFELARVLQRWVFQAGEGQAYLLLKEIYPFSDLRLLEETADRLYDLGIPFIASVQPVFDHTDYPAMQRYLDALRYVQSRNGSIMVNAPVVMDGVEVQGDPLYGEMESFINVLIAGGITPLGIGAELYWSHDRVYTESGMTFFDSAVLFPDEKPVYKDPLDVYRSFRSAPYSLDLDFIRQNFGDRPVADLPMDTAVTCDFPETSADLNELESALKQSWISFADYKQSAHAVNSGTHRVASDHGKLTVDGQEINVSYESGKAQDGYQYVARNEQSFKRLFRVQNAFFMIVIACSLLVFGGLLFIGYRLYRRKFIHFKQGD